MRTSGIDSHGGVIASVPVGQQWIEVPAGVTVHGLRFGDWVVNRNGEAGARPTESLHPAQSFPTPGRYGWRFAEALS